MTRRSPGTLRLAAPIVSIAVILMLSPFSSAQLSERPGNSLDDPIEFPHDLTGLSIKNPRVRVIHTTDPKKLGGSMYLQQIDPWLGYQMGRNLTQREFRARDGVFGDEDQTGKLDGPLLPDGATKMMSRGHVSSCAVCHNTPYRDGGAGATIPKNGGEGRNTPHMFGAGLVEMIGVQMRLQAMAIADDNRDGWISPAEAKGKRCIIHPNGEETETGIDYGSFEDSNRDGKPDLNEVFSPIYVDKEGNRIAFANSLKFEGVAGYKFEIQCFGFGHFYMPFRPPVSTTLRSFIATPFDIHSGLQAFDPTTLDDPDGDGWSGVSNAGALQCLTAIGKDRGAVRGPTGISKDDPDRDGYCEEITEGDLDVAEWYLLNHPAPARGKITESVRIGKRQFEAIGCAVCHVPDWHLNAANESSKDYTQRFDGDRRFFDLDVQYNDKTSRLEGKILLLSGRTSEGALVPRRGAATVRGLYSDLKYHDVGTDFYQTQFDGSIVRRWRTSPLWGVGTTAPYGHDGASLSLDAVIRRHGCEGGLSRQKYEELDDANREAVLAFLNSLVLYQTDRLPCDIDGDGKIAEHFSVAGTDTGVERFNPEWLFKAPGRIEGPTQSMNGYRIISFALTNVADAYGLNLDWLKDTDHDGFPDIVDPAPTVRGYHDGVK